MNIIALLLFILMSIINMIACNKKINILIALSKITLAPLAYINVIINTNFSTKILFLISLCYAFYLIGDILLLSEKTNYFVSGLISFLLGHLSFIIIFFNFKENILIFFVFLILLIYPEILMFKITKNGKNLKKPMQVYSILLALFIALSATTLNPFFIIGTSLFTLSDSFIARNVCYREKRFSSTAVMSTYTLALILLSLGLVYLY